MKDEGGRMKKSASQRRKLSSASRFILHPSSFILCLVLAGCGGMSTRETPPPVARAPDGTPVPAKPPTPRGGGYYLNDGPGDNPPPNLDQVPDAVPKLEPLARGAMRPYVVMGQSYTPMTQLAPYKERGIASWYGRRYHGQQTSSGEIYDMYGMTAAHTILPIPSFARVTNLANNKSVVVRINDRGPFHSDRLIDLSYTAAYKLGVLGGGKAMVEVESIIPDAGTPTTPTLATAPAAAAPAAPAITATPLPPPEVPVATSLPAEPVAPGVNGQAVPPQVAAIDAAAPVVAVTTEQKGLFLQLGAFGSQSNAESYLARLKTEFDWLAPALHVYPKDGLYRVHAGPYANQADARAIADRISQALGVKALVLSR
jgi:rare lipoprotein A